MRERKYWPPVDNDPWDEFPYVHGPVKYEPMKRPETGILFMDMGGEIMCEDIDKKSVFKWWMFGLGLVVVAIVVLTALSYAGIIFETKVERKVYEESYQYKAGQRQKIATLKAQLAEIESQLSDPKLDMVIRRQLQAKQAAIRVQLRAAISTQR